MENPNREFHSLFQLSVYVSVRYPGPLVKASVFPLLSGNGFGHLGIWALRDEDLSSKCPWFSLRHWYPGSAVLPLLH